ncbi:thyroid hormone-inducible hepatic protein-like [Tympanuchus pallidicinctus]|uniref:thyroid hormone-inducible hepatic protein-like n=1 Tax=Tympanuchus pallidicinctus TaxID=109042 RepID=UPI002286CF40|nr:thyroid hormone-inducible hepatic protein-like [Tympanuchus pallidicinctus]
MEQYFSATQKMEQEVMFPSLLRGVFPQDGADPAAGGPADLYERYQLLKAIKPVVERGLASVTDQSPTGNAESDTAPDGGAEEGGNPRDGRPRGVAAGRGGAERRRPRPEWSWGGGEEMFPNRGITEQPCLKRILWFQPPCRGQVGQMTSNVNLF